MGLKKYRNDFADRPDSNGAVREYTRWIGGPSLSLVRNCPTPFGPRTVYVRDEPDTFSSQPAALTFRKRTIRGYLTTTDEGMVFRPYLYGDTVYPIVVD